MAKDDDVKLGIGADESGLVAGMQRAEASVRGSVNEIKTHIESIGSTLGKISGMFAAFAGMAMGGEAIKKIVKSAGDWQTESLKLAKALGVSTEQASVWQVALHRIGVENDTVLSASVKMSKQISTHAETFRKLGVDVLDSAGKHRPLADVMTDLNAKLVAIHDPIEQNRLGLATYGKAWAEVKPLMKLTAEQMAEAEARATQLGLKVGPEGAAMAKKYKESMADVELVGKSLTLQLGNALLPVMTSVGTAFASVAPQIGEVFGTALKYVAVVAINLGSGLAALGTHIGGLMAAAGAALHGDFSGARQILSDMDADIGSIEKKAQGMIDKLFAKPAGDSKPMFEAQAPSEDPNKSRMSEWSERLAIEKAGYQESERLRGEDHQYSLQMELQFWQRLRAAKGNSVEENKALDTKVAETKLAIDRQTWAEEIASYKVREAAFKNNTDARLAVERDLANRLKGIYGENSTQYKEALKAVVDTERQAAATVLALKEQTAAAQRNVALADVNARVADARLLVDLGRATETQMLEVERQAEAERFNIKRAALVDKLTLEANDPDRDPKKLAAINAEILALETEHAAKLSELDRATIKERQKYYTQFYQGLQSGFANVLAGFLKGTQSLGQTIRGLFSAILDTVSQILAQIAAKWLAQRIMNMIGVKSEAASNIGARAAEAGAAGVASFAAAPWPIDIGAPAFGAAMSASALAFGAGLAASGGFDIPSGVNPLVQTHAREMILPAHIADPLRESLASGGGMGSSPIHVHLSAVDGASVRSMVNSHAFQKELRAAVRRSWGQ